MERGPSTDSLLMLGTALSVRYTTWAEVALPAGGLGRPL